MSYPTHCLAGKNCLISINGSTGANLSRLTMDTTNSFYCIPCWERGFKKKVPALPAAAKSIAPVTQKEINA